MPGLKLNHVNKRGPRPQFDKTMQRWSCDAEEIGTFVFDKKSVGFAKVPILQMTGGILFMLTVTWQHRGKYRVTEGTCTCILCLVKTLHLRVSRRSHYSVVIMSTMASQITSLLIVLLKHLFRRRSKKTSKLRVTGRCGQNSPVTGEFPTQSTSNAENVSIWWRHHDFEWRHLVITCDLIPLITRETWKKHIFLIGQYCACSRPLTFNCLVVCRHSDKTILALYSETTWSVGIAQLTHREVRGGGKNPETGGQGIFALTADRVVS